MTPPLIVPKQTPESFSDLRLSDHTIAGLHLFSGGTMFSEWKGAFKDLILTHFQDGHFVITSLSWLW